MFKIYHDNGLPFSDEQDITTREYVVSSLKTIVESTLGSENRSWTFRRIESPILIPTNLVSDEYDKDSYYSVGEFHLRPETTAASYQYAAYLNEHQQFAPPLCVWQNAKSFRRENDQVTRNMRFKEFYQLEFQCIFTEDTKNDYHTAVQEQLRLAVERLTRLPARLIKSDRLPSYSNKTMDIEVDMGYKWLEVCSISLRNDVPFTWHDKRLLNVEIAFGADRLTNVILR